MDIHNEYIAQEKELYFYSGKPVINRVHRFFDINGEEWSFSGATAFTFKIWEEREGGFQVIDWSYPDQLTNTDNTIILNASDTDLERGNYYYEIEYTTGGYPVLLAYGRACFI